MARPEATWHGRTKACGPTVVVVGAHTAEGPKLSTQPRAAPLATTGSPYGDLSSWELHSLKEPSGLALRLQVARWWSAHRCHGYRGYRGGGPRTGTTDTADSRERAASKTRHRARQTGPTGVFANLAAGWPRLSWGCPIRQKGCSPPRPEPLHGLRHRVLVRRQAKRAGSAAPSHGGRGEQGAPRPCVADRSVGAAGALSFRRSHGGPWTPSAGPPGLSNAKAVSDSFRLLAVTVLRSQNPYVESPCGCP
jgi:hypothetical protein